MSYYMHVNIIFEESKGLIHDADVIRSLLLKQGHVVFYNTNEYCTLGVFLEHIHKDYLQFSSFFWFLPNLEWLTMYDINSLSNLNIKCICCKTKDAYAKLQQISKKCEYTSMDSVDMRDDTISKVREYIHVKGTSMYKNTQLLVDLWRKHPEWPTLHVVYRSVIDIDVPMTMGNIIFYQWEVPNEDLKKLMNKCAIHVCCSYCEGFGHYINEARSVGGYVITTNAPPMNELISIECGRLVSVDDREIVRLIGDGYQITAASLEQVIEETIDTSLDDLKKMGECARKLYEENKLFFEKKILEISNG